MNKKINKKTKGTIIILVLIVVVVIVLIIGNNLRQTSQKKEEFQEGVVKVEKETEKIDINEADIETLSKLPGIGPVKSQAIVDYREKNGKFNSLIELTNIKGIGKKTLAKLLPYLDMIGDSAEVYAFVAEETQAKDTVLTSEVTEKININSASFDQLQSLNGIGQKKAQAIIDYRNEHGSFETIEEIMNVKGIGQGIFDKVKNSIEV